MSKKKPLVWITRAQYPALAVDARGRSELKDRIAPYPTGREGVRASRLHAEKAAAGAKENADEAYAAAWDKARATYLAAYRKALYQGMDSLVKQLG